MKHFLLARRLVAAGARFVTCTFSFWDWDGSNWMASPETRRLSRSGGLSRMPH